MRKTIYSKLRYSTGRFAILWIALMLAITFFDTSVQLFIQSIQSTRIIEENTTTLAIEQIVYEMQEVDGVEQVVPVIYGNEVMKKAKKSTCVIDENETNTVFARGEGLMSVYPSRDQNAQGALNQLGSENIAVFHVLNDTGSVYYDDSFGMVTYTLSMKVIQPLAIHPDAEVLEYIDVHGVCNYVGEPVPFEQGKKYVAIGHYFGVELFAAPDAITGEMCYFPEGVYNPPVDIGVGGMQTGIQQFADCEAIMEADDPRVENLVALARQNYEMFMVTGIDQIEGVPLFAMNEAYIDEGRTYTKEEAQRGEPVCLVSTAFAEENELQVGDTISLEMFKHQYRTNTMDGGRFYQINDTVAIIEPQQTEVFTIVGIYQTREWGLNKFCFPPATVFVPLNSLTFQGKKGADYADALILQNGSNEQFLQEVADAGIRNGVYMVYDGGYVQFMESLKNMQKDTAIVMLVCFLLFAIMALASLSMMVQHLKKDAAIMLRIGADRKYTIRYMLLCILPVILLAVISSYIIGCAIHVPLMAVIEKWYAMARPKYSNLTANAQGMLTGNMKDWPLPIGTGAAGLLSCLMTCLLVLSGRERRKG